MTVASDIADDLKAIIIENGDGFSVNTQTNTVDGMGNVKNIVKSTFILFGYLMDITKKDRQVNDMGLAVPGNRILYLAPKYDTVSGGVTTEYVVKEDDLLVDRNGYKWRVVKIIHEPYWNDTQIYKKLVVKSVGLEGSP